jgi:hypothetical protein
MGIIHTVLPALKGSAAGFSAAAEKLLKSLRTSDKQSSACYLLPAGFLLALYFNPEAGGDMFLRNAS